MIGKRQLQDTLQNHFLLGFISPHQYIGMQKDSAKYFLRYNETNYLMAFCIN